MSFENSFPKLESVKKKPIIEIYPGELKRYGKILRGKCPFHPDSGTPNFTIYPETNSFYCFVCAKGGDVIKFYMLLKEVDFKTALRELI